MHHIPDSELADVLRACEAHRIEAGPSRVRIAKLRAKASRGAWIERRERERKAEQAFIEKMDSYFFSHRVNALLRHRG